jgi:hypothetical protein
MRRSLPSRYAIASLNEHQVDKEESLTIGYDVGIVRDFPTLLDESLPDDVMNRISLRHDLVGHKPND